jgi:DNA-binding NarL/FixJ family response regulator
MGARLWVVRTQTAYATMLFARGRPEDHDRTLDMATRALAEAEQIGMVRMVTPIRTLIERLAGAAPAHPLERRPLPDGLTRREADVLRLLADGKTNSEIADELVISVYTVIRHVAHIYQKIGARRRLEAAAYAQRHGLVSPRTAEYSDSSTP